MAKRSKPFEPFCVYDGMGYIRLLRIVAEQEDDILRLVVWDTTREYVWSYAIGTGQVGLRYIVAQCNFVHEAARIRGLAVRHGATPEAIRLLGLVCPVSKMESVEMAEKLKSKGGAAANKGKAPKQADAEALKTAAKKNPVAPKKEAAAEPAKKRGNVEALAKARAATEGDRAALNAKKITVISKDLSNVRDGSYRYLMLQALFRAKTVGAFKEVEVMGKHPTSGDLKYAIDAGFVSVA